MFLAFMKAAKGVAAVIARATASRAGEQDVFMFVIANPLAAALGLREVLRLATQAAAGFDSFCFA